MAISATNVRNESVSVPRGSTVRGVRGGVRPINPSSRLDVANTQKREVKIKYGHTPDKKDKPYTYLANKNVRPGQVVTPYVTKQKADGSSITYKTLGIVQSTSNALGEQAQEHVGNLAGKGIMLKTLPSTDQRSLPGYYLGWDKDAEAKANLIQEARESGASVQEQRNIARIAEQIRDDTRGEYQQGRTASDMNKLQKQLGRMERRDRILSQSIGT